VNPIDHRQRLRASWISGKATAESHRRLHKTPQCCRALERPRRIRFLQSQLKSHHEIAHAGFAASSLSTPARSSAVNPYPVNTPHSRASSSALHNLRFFRCFSLVNVPLALAPDSAKSHRDRSRCIFAIPACHHVYAALIGPIFPPPAQTDVNPSAHPMTMSLTVLLPRKCSSYGKVFS